METIQPTNQQLPIFKHKHKLLQTFSKKKVTIISGKTGSGKSTQLPQYILQSNPKSNIIVCQPRRIAATSLAQRVAYQTKTQLGKLVGYHIGQQTCFSKHTKILFITYGILIQKILFNQKLDYTHIVLDQVHERSLEMDFLFIALRKILQQSFSSEIKLIIMSATIQAGDFSTYFAIDKQTSKFYTPQITIQQQNNRGRRGGNRQPSALFKANYKYDEQNIIKTQAVLLDVTTPFEIKQFFAQDFCDFSPNYYPNQDVRIVDQTYSEAIKLITKAQKKQGDTLIFLPGLYQLNKLKQMIMKQQIVSEEQIVLVHSAFSQQLRQKLFNSTIKHKVIIATNMGESSITLPQCKVVIDFCLTRKNYSNKVTGYHRFQTRLASKSSLLQRAGRVGRVSKGYVFRLISKELYQQLDNFDIPEIKCVSLQMLILRAKQIDSQFKSNIFQDPYQLLLNAMQPPHLKEIDYSIECLLEEEALIYKTSTKEIGHKYKYKGDLLKLTEVGRFIVNLPCELRVSKMILIAMKLGVAEVAYRIAGQLTCSKDFFVHQEKRESIQSFLQTITFYDKGNCNDYLLRYHIFMEWKNYFYDTFKNKRNGQKAQKSPQSSQRKYKQKTVREVQTKTQNLLQKSSQKQNIQQIENNQYVFSFSEQMSGELRIVEEFNKLNWSYQQKDWCIKKCVYPSTMRQILRITENIAFRIQSMGYKLGNYIQDSNTNRLILMCFVTAFKGTQSHIQCQTKKGKSTNNNILESFVVINASNDKIPRDKLKEFIKPLKYKSLSYFEKENYYQLHGDSSLLAKFMLPCYYKIPVQKKKQRMTDVFRMLQKSNPNVLAQYSYQMNPIHQGNQDTVVLNESINKVLIKQTVLNEYLLTYSIQKTKVGKCMIKSCAKIDEFTFIIILILSRKKVQFSIHNSRQMLQNMKIDNQRVYRIPFIVRNKELQKLKQLRRKFYRQKNNIINDAEQQLTTKDIQDILRIIKQLQSKPLHEKWENYFHEKHDLKSQELTSINILNQDNLQLFYELQQCPQLIESKIPYYVRYRNWKLYQWGKFNMKNKFLQIQKAQLICRQCFPFSVTLIDDYQSYNYDRNQLSYNPYGTNIIQQKDSAKNLAKCHLHRHKLGQVINEDWIQIHSQSVLIYCPFDKIRPFYQTKDEIQQIERLEKEGQQQIKLKRQQIEDFSCLVCLQYSHDLDEQRPFEINPKLRKYESLPQKKNYSNNNSQNFIWQHIAAHLKENKHITQVKQFNKSLFNTSQNN